MTDPVGSKDTHKKHRQRLRRKLEQLGYPPDEIQRIIDRKKRGQDYRRERDAVAEAFAAADRAQVAAEREQLEAETYKRLNLDDSKFRPRAHDPLLTGAARATGVAAKAVRRSSTLTRYQYDEASK